MIRAVIADDEPLARRKLREMVESVGGIHCVGEAADGPAAIEAVRHLAPDLLFLDIRMPGATGLEVLDELTDPPHVIFTTAYDQYAVTAFELQALDYLLKPFGRERFLKAVERARAVLADRRGPTETVAVGASANADGSSPLERARTALDPPGPVTRLFVRERGRIVPLSVDRIERLEARGDYVALHASGRRHLVNVRLRDLEQRLDAERFLRVHRSHMVNLEFVAAMVPYDGSRLQIVMKDGTKVVASRARSKALRRRVM